MKSYSQPPTRSVIVGCHMVILLSAYLQTPIHDYQVAGIMVLVKLARTNQSAQHIDNWVDLCSYGALAGQLATEENELYV
jgi:hypothetical protein